MKLSYNIAEGDKVVYKGHEFKVTSIVFDLLEQREEYTLTATAEPQPLSIKEIVLTQEELETAIAEGYMRQSTAFQVSDNDTEDNRLDIG